ATERGSVRGFHQDLPRPRRHDLANDKVGHHLEFQRQVVRREDQDARLAGFGAHPPHRFQRGVEGERGRFYQRSKRKTADVHIGSSRRAMLTGRSWSLPLLNPEEQPGASDTPGARYIPADFGPDGRWRLLL